MIPAPCGSRAVRPTLRAASQRSRPTTSSGFGADGIFRLTVDNGIAGAPVLLLDNAIIDEPLTVDTDGTLVAGFQIGSSLPSRVDVARFNPATGVFTQNLTTFGTAGGSFRTAQLALPSAAGLAIVWGENDTRSILTACRVGSCPTGTTLSTNFNGSVPQSFARIGPDR